MICIDLDPGSLKRSGSELLDFNRHLVILNLNIAQIHKKIRNIYILNMKLRSGHIVTEKESSEESRTNVVSDINEQKFKSVRDEKLVSRPKWKSCCNLKTIGITLIIIYGIVPIIIYIHPEIVNEVAFLARCKF